MKSSGGLIDLYRRPHTKNKASIKGTSRDLGNDECARCVVMCVSECVCVRKRERERE